MSENHLRHFVQRLQENDLELTELDFHHISGVQGPYPLLGGPALFQELLDALQRNQSVTKVGIILRFLLGMSEEEKIRLYRAIGSMPLLDTLQMKSSGLAKFGLRVSTEAIRCTHQLKHLTLYSVHFSAHYRTNGNYNTKDEDYIDFCRAIRGLEMLESFHLYDVEDSFDLNPLVKALSGLPALQHLTIQALAYTSPPSARLSRESLLGLSWSPTLKSMSLRRLQLAPILPELLFRLQYNQILERLSLEDYHMDQSCGMAIAGLLHGNKTLEHLQILFRTLPSESSVSIAKALASNQSIRSFEFSVNLFAPDVSHAYSHLLAHNSSDKLSHLSLAKNLLSDDCIMVLAEALQRNNHIRSLVLSETHMTDQGVAFLGPALSRHGYIESLDLSLNRLGNQSCVALANMLETNQYLKHLNLSGNQIGDVGGIALAETMRQNWTLASLDLRDNHNMDPPTYQAWELTMVSNPTLSNLEMPNFPLDSSITSFLKLNGLGRRHLLQELSNAQDWVETLTSCTDDIHCLQFMIRANPALCGNGLRQ